jgi:cysteinyl-tRNA synthetase
MQLYNTITRKKETFVPLSDDAVKMYVCGITAYDYCHIGHARSAVVFDVLVRYLRSVGYKVTFVRNFTDVDDKIINRANAEGTSSEAVAEQFIQAFYEDMDRLGVLRADIEPRATEHIQDMIDLISTLESRGVAYATSSGDVYFRVRKFESYGALSGRNIEELQSGARIQPGEEKEDPLDFALWKSAKPGEPYWESPWGKGRPGWHIECSAMSKRFISMPFDIHGGGQDLAFPHHENERAQSEAAFDTEFARYWVHNGFVQINSEKMSKSLNNFITIRDILAGYLPEVLRYFLLTKHYRSPLDYSTSALDEAEKGIKRIYTGLSQIDAELSRTKWSKSPLPSEISEELGRAEAAWAEAMADDMNTAGALGHIFTLIRLANRIIEDKTLRKSEEARTVFERILADIARWGEVLGLFKQDRTAFLTALRDCRAGRISVDGTEVRRLIDERNAARKEKDFARSDAIREELAAMNVVIRDTPAGTEWDVEI